MLDKIKNNTFELHQSRLKSLLGDKPWMFLSKEFKTSIDMTRGNIAETILLENEKLEEKFEIIKHVPSPSKGLDVVNLLIEQGHDGTLDERQHEIITICNNLDYGVKWKIETIMNRIKDSFTEYYNWHTTRDFKKELIDPDVYKEAEDIARGWDLHPKTKDYFQITKDQTFLVQLELQWEYLECPCGGILDALVINHKDQTLRPLDLKTTSLGIKSAARRFRWDIQGAFYKLGVELSPPKGLEHYKVLNPIFIVSEVKYPEHPRVFEMNSRDLMTGQFGVEKYTTASYGIGTGKPINLPYNIEGFHQLINRYKFHQAADSWNMKMELYDEDYIEDLNIF